MPCNNIAKLCSLNPSIISSVVYVYIQFYYLFFVNLCLVLTVEQKQHGMTL